MSGAYSDDAYGRDGFEVIRGAVLGRLLDEMRDAVRRVQDGVAALPPRLLARLTLERDLSPERRGGIDAAAVGDAIFIMSDPVAFDDSFWALLSHPAILSAVRRAIGSRDVAAHFMNVTIKHPCFGRSIAWHRDYPNDYACPAGSGFVRVMLCLDGMSELGGATQFIPGSHILEDAVVAERRPAVGWRPDARETVAVCCDPGDLVVIHPKVLHGSGVNTSLSPRRNVVLQAGEAAIPLRCKPIAEAVTGCRLRAWGGRWPGVDEMPG